MDVDVVQSSTPDETLPATNALPLLIVEYDRIDFSLPSRKVLSVRCSATVCATTAQVLSKIIGFASALEDFTSGIVY